MTHEAAAARRCARAAPTARSADFAVDWVIGGKRMQDDVTVFPDGRWQVLPVYFQVTQRRWVDYTEAKQGPLAPDHPFYWTNLRRMANRECLDCHVTGLVVRFDRAAQHWTTEFTDAGVACEDCHGPGARHADTTLAADIFSPQARVEGARARRLRDLPRAAQPALPAARHRPSVPSRTALRRLLRSGRRAHRRQARRATSSPTRGRSRRASSTRRCCSRPATARAARPA